MTKFRFDQRRELRAWPMAVSFAAPCGVDAAQGNNPAAPQQPRAGRAQTGNHSRCEMDDLRKALAELAVQWRHNALGRSRRDAHAAGTWRSCARDLEQALAADALQDGDMHGVMVEADFIDDTLTFRMEPGYAAAAGKYAITRIGPSPPAPTTAAGVE